MSNRSPETYTMVAIATAWMVFFLAGLLATGWPVYPLWLVAGTLVTAGTFAYDKFQARNGGRRIPEIALLASVLAGGVIGGWSGMLVVRHKTRQARFWITQWIATALHVAALALLFA